MGKAVADEQAKEKAELTARHAQPLTRLCHPAAPPSVFQQVSP